MDRWLDSLSEDWVSPPRSPRSSSPQQGSVLKESPSQASNGSQSRIPRYKPRAASTVSTGRRKEAERTTSMRGSDHRETVLREKTSSNLNMSQKGLPSAQIEPQALNAASMKLRGRDGSSGSRPLGQQDTVQIKSSPAKGRGAHATPEWKRRVLKENVGGDLFSPIRLESVFRPPTSNSKAKGKPTGKKRLFHLENISSSSPPVQSMATQETSVSRGPSTRPAFASSSKDELQNLDQLPGDSSAQERVSSDDHDIEEKDHSSRTLPGSHSPGSQASPTAPIHHATSVNRSSITGIPNNADKTYTSSAYDRSRNEKISPFIVSRQNTVDGRVQYAAVDMSLRRLHSQMDKLRLQQQNIPSSRSSDHGVDYTDSPTSKNSLLREQMDEVTSQSLPDDLSMGTDAYAANGGFVSVHRGGYSNDGSFQRRPFSPSLLPDLDGPSQKTHPSTSCEVIRTPRLLENFSQTKSNTPLYPPLTPDHNNAEDAGSFEMPRSSGSPLKLFDNYDTFTNDRLARRISRFEQTLNRELETENFQVPSSPSPRRRRPYKPSQKSSLAESSKDRCISSFGDGDLKDHPFSPHQPPNSHILLKQLRQDANYYRSPEHKQNGSRSKRLTSYGSIRSGNNRTKVPISQQGEPGDGRKQNRVDGTTTRTRQAMDDGKYEGHRPPDQDETLRTATGKRLPYSPAKDPAPKRRRTLQNPEGLDQASNFLQRLQVMEIPIQSMHGRKRKDALYDDGRQAADPSTLATRQILQPRAPVSGLTGSATKFKGTSHSNEPSGAEDGKYLSRFNKDQHSNFTIDPPTQIVAGALASVALNTVQDITNGPRKASVTTADFFNEARQLMQLIRAKGRPRSSHTTTERSKVDDLTIVEESVVDDSTKDEFSRPPSRDGGSLSRLRELKRTDARIISHLRKFEDEDELGLALSSSLKVLQINQSLKELESLANEGPGVDNPHSGTESDPPNIRIRESTVQSHKRKYSSSTHEASTSERQRRPHESQSASAPSSSRSNPTGSSHSSNNRMVIAPETVAHILSDQMAGMVFDRQKQLWVKRKSSPRTGGMEDLNHSASEDTEEDLFGDIPDLSVDEMEELQRVKDAVSSVKSVVSATDKKSVHDLAASAWRPERVPAKREEVESIRPRTADGKSIEPVENSSAPSKYSHLTSSGPAPGTRATSWGNEFTTVKEPQLPRGPLPMISTNLNPWHAEEVEHEISILDGRQSRTPRHQNKHRQARVVTVAFSSPLVDQKEAPSKRDDGSEAWDERDELRIDESLAGPSSDRRSTCRRISSGILARSGQRKASRRVSISNQSCLTRPMSRLDERDEMSLVQYSAGDRHTTMEVAISTPQPLSRSLLVPPPSRDQPSSIGFCLSPLPDFTVHQIDKPIDLNLSQVAKRRGSQGTGNKLSLAAQDLVKKLTDFEPYEPYWDHLRSVNLHNKDLRTLHMLDDFCGRVEELDVSNNRIGELDGIPYTVRLLNLRGNCLSDLAAWNFLQNLQYLDVSGNQLRSLQGFQCLVHLRALKAEHNEVESLEGLEELDGLTSLSVKGNRLRKVDFDNFDLRRLAHMDLRNNELAEVSNLHRLAALETCNLSDNNLESLDFSISVPLFKLRALNLSKNRLSFIDLADLPHLKTLNLDKNSIGSIESLSSLPDLETLSWREQTLVPAYGFSEVQYQHGDEVRNLCLSGDLMSTFAPSTPFLNLHHLELASTGLHTFSSDLGLKCPNLRIVNANYNAIHDLRPLLSIVKLQKLFLVGNRISKLRRTVTVLEHLSRDLKEIDLRNNPLTVGFYTPQQSLGEEKGLVVQKHRHHDDADAEDPETRMLQAYLLPQLDKEADNLSRERLDEDTKIRRRVHELLIVHACNKLERLDGLEVDKRMVQKRDGVWDRLLELGVVNRKGMTKDECNE